MMKKKKLAQRETRGLRMRGKRGRDRVNRKQLCYIRIMNRSVRSKYIFSVLRLMLERNR